MIAISFSKEAKKFLLKLTTADRNKISKALNKIAIDPTVGEKLKGEYAGLLKLYAWPYRVIYAFNSRERIVLVVTIGHRQGVYK